MEVDLFSLTWESSKNSFPFAKILPREKLHKKLQFHEKKTKKKAMEKINQGSFENTKKCEATHTRN